MKAESSPPPTGGVDGARGALPIHLPARSGSASTLPSPPYPSIQPEEDLIYEEEDYDDFYGSNEDMHCQQIQPRGNAQDDTLRSQNSEVRKAEVAKHSGWSFKFKAALTAMWLGVNDKLKKVSLVNESSHMYQQNHRHQNKLTFGIIKK